MMFVGRVLKKLLETIPVDVLVARAWTDAQGRLQRENNIGRNGLFDPIGPRLAARYPAGEAASG